LVFFRRNSSSSTSGFLFNRELNLYRFSLSVKFLKGLQFLATSGLGVLFWVVCSAIGIFLSSQASAGENYVRKVSLTFFHTDEND
jgi:hypothetical protein